MAEQYKRKSEFGKFYFKDPRLTILHRTDGPACEYFDGDKAWYLNGAKHRLDGPAYEYASGEKSWYVNGMAIFRINKIGKLLDRMV